MRAKSFDINLGKTPLYSYDEEKDTNIFAAAPTLPMSAYNVDKTDLRRRDELVTALDTQFKDWKHSYMEFPNGRRSNALHFGNDNGIVRYDNEVTGESFAFKYNPYTPSLVLSGMLKTENVEKLNTVFKEYGKGLEKIDLMKEINLEFDNTYKHLNPLFEALEKNGIIIADKKADKNFSDRLLLTIPNESNFALKFNLNYGNSASSKTLHRLSKEVLELSSLIKPQHDSIQFLNRKSFSELNYGEMDKLVNQVAQNLELFKIRIMRAAKSVLENSSEHTAENVKSLKPTRSQDYASLYKDGVSLYDDTGR